MPTALLLIEVSRLPFSSVMQSNKKSEDFKIKKNKDHKFIHICSFIELSNNFSFLPTKAYVVSSNGRSRTLIKSEIVRYTKLKSNASKIMENSILAMSQP